MTLVFSGHPENVRRPDSEQVFAAHSRRIAGLCRHMLRDRALAEDATSEVFLRIRDGIARYDESVPLERWVLRITANYCIDLIRRRQLERRWIAVVESPFDPVDGTTPLTLVLLKEQRENMERAIESLDEPYRIPLVLRYYAGLSYDEIATELGLEKSQVAGRIFRAKQMLRAVLREAV